MLPAKIKNIDKVMYYSMLGRDSNISVIKNINENAQNVIDNGNLGDIPLVILTAGKDTKWLSSQKELMEWSTNSRYENIEDANHYIHWSHRNIVVEQIVEMIKSTDNEKD